MQIGEIIGLILVSLVFECFTHLFLADNLDIKFYTPRSIYEESNMNWFGCIIVYIILFPFGFVFAICGFLKWLFTVGRK